MRVAALFPGFGTPAPALSAAWDDHDRDDVVATVARRAGLERRQLLAARPGAPREVVECAIYANSLIAWRSLCRATTVRPVVLAGHDLGEITAAVASGALDAGDGAALVAQRAAAIRSTTAEFPSGLVAVLDLDDSAERALIAQLPPDVTVADDNAPGQLLLSGPDLPLQTATARAQALGARLAAPETDPGVHSPIMTPVMVGLATTLSRMPVNAPALPFAAASTADRLGDATAVRRALAEGILAPVRWRQLLERLADDGLDGFVEIGPGVLHELAHRTVAAVPAVALRDPGDVEAVAEWLDGGPRPADPGGHGDAVAAG